MPKKISMDRFPDYLIKINIQNNKTIDQVSVELFFQQSMPKSILWVKV